MLLTELRMGQADLQSTLAQVGGKSLIGFEIETYSTLPDEVLYGLNLVKDVLDITSIDEIFDHFQLSSNGQKRFKRDLEDFWDRKADEWASEHWMQLANQAEEISDEEQKRAYDLAIDKFYSKHDTKSMEEYYKEEFNSSANDFIEHYFMMPNEGWYRTDTTFFQSGKATFGEIQKAFFQHTFDQLNKLTGGGIRSVEEDGSIRTDKAKQYSAEIVTKPLRAQVAFDNLAKIFDWMKREVFFTNESTGLHINVSIDDVKQVDWLKLGLLLGEQYEMFRWKREKNVYTQSQMGSLIDKLKMSNITPNDIASGGENFDKAVEILNQYIDKIKYRTFNVLHMDNEGYVEFRIAGGKNYHDNFERVEQSALRYLRVLHAASDKNAYRKEYVKKVYTMLANAGEFESTPNEQGEKSLEQQLTTLWKSASGIQTVSFDEGVIADVERAKDAVARIATLTSYKLIENNLKPSSGVKRLLTTAARKYKVTNQNDDVKKIVSQIERSKVDKNQQREANVYALTLSLLGLQQT